MSHIISSPVPETPQAPVCQVGRVVTYKDINRTPGPNMEDVDIGEIGRFMPQLDVTEAVLAPHIGMLGLYRRSH